MTFPLYRLPPELTWKSDANKLYAKPMALFDGSVPVVRELISVDPDQDYTAVPSLCRKTTDK